MRCPPDALPETRGHIRSERNHVLRREPEFPRSDCPPRPLPLGDTPAPEGIPETYSYFSKTLRNSCIRSTADAGSPVYPRHCSTLDEVTPQQSVAKPDPGSCKSGTPGFRLIPDRSGPALAAGSNRSCTTATRRWTSGGPQAAVA